MILYRIEHKRSSRGPFTSGMESSYVMQEAYQMPTPDKDNIGEFPGYYLFAFRDLNDAIRYFVFDHMCELELARYNFVLRAYRLNDLNAAIFGWMQAVFDPSSVELECEIDFNQ